MRTAGLTQPAQGAGPWGQPQSLVLWGLRLGIVSPFETQQLTFRDIATDRPRETTERARNRE